MNVTPENSSTGVAPLHRTRVLSWTYAALAVSSTYISMVWGFGVSARVAAAGGDQAALVGQDDELGTAAARDELMLSGR